MEDFQCFNDEQLQQMSVSGSVGAEDALAARYNQLVRICARPYFLAGGDSEDLTQETFVRAYRAFARFDPSRASSATWLLTIARRLFVDEWRRTSQHVYAETEVPESVAGEESPEAELCRRETNAALYRAMAMLSERERHLIALKYAAGLRNREIARILGKSERHTAVLLCRTLAKLRKILEKEGVYES